ncbi:MAG: TolC family protein [Acidobacteria bacterium]|nr:TolC family protein [Acidobacteriota bacterium]MYJ03687.1 TolC family protein [Acidobacteriota bacterium]
MTTVLAESPDIERSTLAIEADAADRITAASPFDFRMRTTVGGGRDNIEVSGALAPTGNLTTLLSGTKLFRSGVAISADASLGRSRGLGSLSLNQADSSVSIRVPLAGGRKGGAAAGIERSAEQSYRAALLDRSHVSALAVLQAVAGYWQYAAAQERLEIHRASAERAEVLVEVTRALIRADERPASDLDLVTSNLANKRTAVSASEQGVIDARYALGLAMGLQADQLQGLGLPLTAFPAPGRVSERGPGVLPAVLVRMAIGARRDLAAARARRNGARLAWQGALHDLRPRWDVVATVGHTSVYLSPNQEKSATPLGTSGLNTFVQMRYEPIATNSAARGLALRTETSYRTAAVAANDLTRRIGANVLAATAALNNTASEVVIAQDAVRLSGRSVETEEAKLRLGLATLFDAILSTDALTSAQLRLTDARYRYAIALARLRFETGTLLQHNAGGVSAETHRVLTLELEGESQ